VRVLVVDRRAFFGVALTTILARSPHVEEAVTLTQSELRVPLPPLRWDVVVADHISGRVLAPHLSGARLVVLVDTDDVAQIAELVAAGASAVCLPDDGVDDVAAAVDTVAQGGMRLPPSLVGPVLEELMQTQARAAEAQQTLSRLTARERDVLRLLAQGLGRAEIAQELTLSPHTVRTHVQHLLAKLSLHSQLEASALGRRLFEEQVDEDGGQVIDLERRVSGGTGSRLRRK
jgi:DNA-binding NarL/FixJ family response regulator